MALLQQNEMKWPSISDSGHYENKLALCSPVYRVDVTEYEVSAYSKSTATASGRKSGYSNPGEDKSLAENRTSCEASAGEGSGSQGLTGLAPGSPSSQFSS